MSALGLKIASKGPGTGPKLLPALYSVGVDDYAHRWSGDRLTDAVGSTVTLWQDATAAGVPLIGNDVAFQVAEVSGVKYTRKIPGTAIAGGIKGLNVFPTPGDPYTVVMASYIDPSETAGGTRQMVNGPWNSIGRASNGSWQVSGAGGYVLTGNTPPGWEFFGLATSGGPLVNGSFTQQRGTTVRNSLGSGTSIAANATRDMVFLGLQALDWGVAEIITWNRKLTETELATVRSAMIARYPMF